MNQRAFLGGAIVLAGICALTSFAKPAVAKLSVFEPRFQEALQRTFQHIHEESLKVQSKNSDQAKALTLLNQAAYEYVQDDLDLSHRYLKESLTLYNHYSFHYLLSGMIYFAKTDRKNALSQFELYYFKSSHLDAFESKFIRGIDYHELRRGIYTLLVHEGIVPDDSTPNPNDPFLMRFLHPVFHPMQRDILWNVVFLVVLIGGGILLILSKLGDADFDQAPFTFIHPVYIASWFAYFFWLVDIFSGLPWGLSRYQLTLYLIVLFAIVGPIKHFTERFWDQHKPLEKDYCRCPQCHSTISCIVLECPECKADLAKTKPRK